MRLWVCGFLAFVLAVGFAPQKSRADYYCRTAPNGASTRYCASEAFITQHFPKSSVAGHVATFGDDSGQLLVDGGGAPVTTAGTGLLQSGNALSLDPSYLRGFLGGLTLSNDGATPNSVLDTAAGVATDSTNAALIKIAAFTKSTGGAWAAGSGNNGMGNGLTIANSTWYHVCLASNSGTPDEWFDTSATCANRPSGISDTKYRRIGSFKTDGSAHIVAFTQFGDYFRWATPVLDVSNVSFGASYASTTISVPPGVQVIAHGNLNPGTGGSLVQIRPVGASDAMTTSTSTFTTNPLGKAGSFVTSGTNPSVVDSWREVTNASAQISIGGNGTIGSYLTTEGWEDRRGRDN